MFYESGSQCDETPLQHQHILQLLQQNLTLIKHNDMKVYKGSGSEAPCILKLSTNTS